MRTPRSGVTLLRNQAAGLERSRERAGCPVSALAARSAGRE